MDNQEFAVPGLSAAGIAAAIKKNGGPDLALIVSRVPCAAAALFTQNQFPAAPVLHGRQLLAYNNEAIYGVVINSGCAMPAQASPATPTHASQPRRWSRPLAPPTTQSLS